MHPTGSGLGAACPLALPGTMHARAVDSQLQPHGRCNPPSRRLGLGLSTMRQASNGRRGAALASSAPNPIANECISSVPAQTVTPVLGPELYCCSCGALHSRVCVRLDGRFCSHHMVGVRPARQPGGEPALGLAEAVIWHIQARAPKYQGSV